MKLGCGASQINHVEWVSTTVGDYNMHVYKIHRIIPRFSIHKFHICRKTFFIHPSIRLSICLTSQWVFNKYYTMLIAIDAASLLTVACLVNKPFYKINPPPTDGGNGVIFPPKQDHSAHLEHWMWQLDKEATTRSLSVAMDLRHGDCPLYE